ncbi:hypothetical protein MRQ36_27380 [Micromonospora sp. R77]|uniref:hypothetical protein n=1 Tax=Micromonospora sp. R77 TaxID=2925836 RepID=UPI001F61E7B1|nr:hypothetical protein [Micromonospora sp. R77]MCI4066066.1 hypothetical protein [Micromonospora sp. R77]
MLRYKSESDRLSANFGEFSSLASAHVMIAAFEVAVGRLFASAADLEEIRVFVADMRRGFGVEFPSLETETLIRHMLGEEVAIGGLSVKTKTLAMMFTLMAWADFQQRAEVGVASLVCEAERKAFARGYQPEVA